MMLYFLSRKWKSNFIPKTFPFDSVNWEASVESKEFSFFSVFLINFFHSVSFFTSHLIAHFSCSLFHSSIENWFSLYCVFASSTLRNLFSLIFLARFSRRVRRGDFFFFFWFVSLVASKFCKRPTRGSQMKNAPVGAFIRTCTLFFIT